MSADLQSVKGEALENAAKQVCNLLQHPDQLDKVEQCRRRTMRNKASVEARLKSAVQSQLDGIRSGLEQLQGALKDIKEIKKSMQEVDTLFKNCSNLSNKLEDIKKCQGKHSQLSNACEHLRNIFNVPETIQKCQKLIGDGKLLHAHKCLQELEYTRDEMLYEVHRTSQGGTPADKTPVYRYFADVEKLSGDLEKQLWVIIMRLMSIIKRDPSQLVTALRIIEREERADKRAEERRKNTGFLPPGRPKNLRITCFDMLQRTARDKFESLQMQLDDKVTEKMWLVKHLERTRQKIVDDLRTIKTLCQPCFPPSYNIFEKFVQFYHSAVSLMLEDLCCQRLDSTECINVLNWLKEYGSPNCMMHPDLLIDTQALSPLLKPSVEKDLIQSYLDTTATKIQEVITRIIETEKKDWNSSNIPDSDGQGFYNTPLPVFLFQLVEQNLELAAHTQGDTLKIQMVDICMEQLQTFQRDYRNAIREYKAKHFQERGYPEYFVHYMVAIANNCKSCIVNTERLKTQLLEEMGMGMIGEDRTVLFQSIMDCFELLGEECCGYLLDEVFLDLDPHFGEILSRVWLHSTNALDTIVLTVEDYCNDWVHLKPSFFDYIMDKCCERVLTDYVKAVMSRRITFKSYDERKTAGQTITQDAKKLDQMFSKLANFNRQDESPCNILRLLAEVIKLKDTSMLSLELSGIAAKYKDFNSDHGLALLALRGDMGRNDAKQLIMETKLPDKGAEMDDNDASVFSQVTVPPTIFDKLETVKLGLTSS